VTRLTERKCDQEKHRPQKVAIPKQDLADFFHDVGKLKRLDGTE
jgi:hypothetical protein